MGDEHQTGGRILLVEHDPVITITRRPGAAAHLLAPPDLLARQGVEVAETDRGGDITYHGPGQLVVYPILDLNFFGLRLHDYMRLLEGAVIDPCAAFGVAAERDPSATGVWVRSRSGTGVPPVGTPPDAETGVTPVPLEQRLAKICAMGVRVRKWISLHGLAINVTTNLAHFNLIVPCGLAGRPVTSLQAELGSACPSMDGVKRVLVENLIQRLRSARQAVVARQSVGA